MKIDLKRFLPPGYDPKPELNTLLWTALGALCFSFGFFFRLFDGVRELYDVDTRNGRHLIPGAEMPPYDQVFGSAASGFAVVIVLAVVIAFMHYSYHHQGSRSIYLMKRLPKRSVLHFRCLALPVAITVAAVLTAALLYLLYYGMYLITVPAECLPGAGGTVTVLPYGG